jgi:hypothetical protein
MDRMKVEGGATGTPTAHTRRSHWPSGRIGGSGGLHHQRSDLNLPTSAILFDLSIDSEAVEQAGSTGRFEI